jgi:hypothetical protein
MPQSFGYMVDLSGLQFGDEGESTVTTFQAMPYGVYNHPIYGKIDLNEERAQRFAANVNNGVRGQDLDIDYDHKAHHGEAAGWVKAAEARKDGLYLTVEWTKTAFQKLKEKAYRYFSPEFKDEWKHPQTGQVFKDVLFGGGITNRPFLKGIMPVNLSELYQEHEKEEPGMDPKKLRLLLGLPEDATDEQVNAKLDERAKEIEDAANDADKDKDKAGAQEVETVVKDQLAAVGLSEEVIKRLTEDDNPAVKALTEAVSTLTTTVATQGVALQLAETDSIVKRLSEPNENNVALSTSAQEKLKSVLLKLSEPAARKEIVGLVEVLTSKGGTVQLGETGESGKHGENDGDGATNKFNDAVKKLMDENEGMSYGDAVVEAASRNPELFEAHRQGAYSFREN